LFTLGDEDFERLTGKLFAAIARANSPSNAYTILGMLPNIAAARVSNVFDLNGPTVVVDAGARTIVETIRAAERWFAFAKADVMLAAGFHLDTRSGSSTEGALLLALATPETARERGWPVAALLTVGAVGDDLVTIRAAAGDSAPSEMSIRSTMHGIAG